MNLLYVVMDHYFYFILVYVDELLYHYHLNLKNDTINSHVGYITEVTESFSMFLAEVLKYVVVK